MFNFHFLLCQILSSFLHCFLNALFKLYAFLYHREFRVNRNPTAKFFRKLNFWEILIWTPNGPHTGPQGPFKVRQRPQLRFLWHIFWQKLTQNDTNWHKVRHKLTQVNTNWHKFGEKTERVLENASSIIHLTWPSVSPSFHGQSFLSCNCGKQFKPCPGR